LIEEGAKAARGHLEDIRNAMPSRKRWFTLMEILRPSAKKGA
jgi:hypothetical protein